jgi:hypothetical protein
MAQTQTTTLDVFKIKELTGNIGHESMLLKMQQNSVIQQMQQTVSIPSSVNVNN